MAKKSTVEDIAFVKQKIEHELTSVDEMCDLAETLKLPEAHAARLKAVVEPVRARKSHRGSLLVILTEIERAIQLGA